jgi:hypothetical protein
MSGAIEPEGDGGGEVRRPRGRPLDSWMAQAFARPHRAEQKDVRRYLVAGAAGAPGAAGFGAAVVTVAGGLFDMPVAPGFWLS